MPPSKLGFSGVLSYVRSEVRSSVRIRCAIGLAVAWHAPAVADAVDVIAGAPVALTVSIYRTPARSSGSINLNYLNGFALISETRQVQLPAGLSRLRFEGVAGGIDAASAIVSGLPKGVLEKNRDADLLSPAALIASTVGRPVTLERSNRKSGKTERIAGTIESSADGVVFRTAEGYEALRCSGLPETFVVDGGTALSAHPTLSVLVASAQPTTRQVTLSYLARGFDWSADYTATLSADGKTLDLGAWVTLANSNGESFPDAHTQVIAGRVNHENGDIEPFAIGGSILAQCWPRGSTSDVPDATRQLKNRGLMRFKETDAVAAPSAMALGEVTLTAQRVQQEQLGDLKLYRIPERTTVASHQSKQVRLMDRSRIPVQTVYAVDLTGFHDPVSQPAERLLRTSNTAANHLGLPLPAGSIAMFVERQSQHLLTHQATLRDLAVNEEVELSLGASADVHLTAVHEKVATGANSTSQAVTRVEVSNARAQAIDFELRLQLASGVRIVHSEVMQGKKNGRPLFKLKVPANATQTFRFESVRAR